MRHIESIYLGALVVLVSLAIPPLVADEVAGDPAPADERPHAFDMKRIELSFDIDFENESIDAHADLEIAPREGASRPASLELDAVDMDIRAVAVDGREAGFKYDGKTLSVAIADGELADRPVTLSIDYRLDHPRKGFYFVLPDLSEPELPRQAYTQSEPDETRYWIPCFDQPNDKVTSDVTVTVPTGLFALSNGGLVDRTEDSAAGKVTYHWKQAVPHSVYLLVVTAGEYVAIEDMYGEIPVVYYVSKDEAENARRSFEKTPAMMECFERLTGVEYPYEKYAQITVRRYMWGGMEHTTATTLNSDTIHDERSHLDWNSDGLVAHELAHQWFGDLVTCRTWAHLWLNEGFATYFNLLWIEHDRGVDAFRLACNDTRGGYIGETQWKVRPIVDPTYKNPYDVFDGHSYSKASQVLHNLRFVMGDEAFFAGVHRYLVENRAKSVTTERFQRACEEAAYGEASGQLEWFFDQWFAKPGHPKFKVAWEYLEEKQAVRLVVEQVQDTSHGVPIFRTPVDIGIVHAGPDRSEIARPEIVRVEVTQQRHEFEIPAASRPRTVYFDHGHWLLSEIDFPKSADELLLEAEANPDPVGRLRAVGDLQAHLGDFRVVEALAEILRADDEVAVRGRAVEVLAERKDDLALYHLLGGLADEESTVRERIAARLDWFGKEKTADLARRLSSEDPSYSVISSAAASLAESKADGAYEFLIELSRVESFRDRIRQAATQALGALGDPRAIEWALERARPPSPPGVRKAAFELLSNLGKEREDVIDFLLAQFADPHHTIRGAAAEALAEIGSPRTLEPLKKQRDLEPIERTKGRISGAIEKLEKKIAEKTGEAEKLRQEELKVREERLKLAEERLGLREKMLELRTRELDLEAKELELRKKELELREKAAAPK